MKDLPFSASPDAEARIKDLIRLADGNPAFANLVPGMVLALNYRFTDKDGKITESFNGEYFQIGWYKFDDFDPASFVKFNILELTVYVFPDAVERLKNRQLVLEVVEVGFPKPSDKLVPLLRAR